MSNACDSRFKTYPWANAEWTAAPNTNNTGKHRLILLLSQKRTNTRQIYSSTSRLISRVILEHFRFLSYFLRGKEEPESRSKKCQMKNEEVAAAGYRRALAFMARLNQRW